MHKPCRKKDRHTGVATQSRNVMSRRPHYKTSQSANAYCARRDCLFPPLKARSENYIANTNIASQELRRTMAQLTGGDLGTDERLLKLRENDSVSPLDILGDMCTAGSDDEKKHMFDEQNDMFSGTLFGHCVNVVENIPIRRNEPPWYQPKLSVALLTRNVCSKYDKPLFSRPTFEQLSTISNLSKTTHSSISSSPSFFSSPNQKKGKKEGKEDNNKKEFNKVTEPLPPVNVKTNKIPPVVNPNNSEEEARHLQMEAKLRKKAIFLWCDKVILASDEKYKFDPTKAHETSMFALRKQEERMQLMVRFEQHQMAQEREQRRALRIEEEKKMAILRVSSEVRHQKNGWRSLLRSWTSQNSSSDDNNNGNEWQGELVVTTTEKNTLEPIRPSTPQKTFAKCVPQTPLQFVPSGVDQKDIKSLRSDDVCNDTVCCPLRELQRFLEVIISHSTCPGSVTSTDADNFAVNGLGALISSRKGVYFPPDGFVYMTMKWAQRVIHSDDLPKLKQLTCQLAKCVASANIFGGQQDVLHTSQEVCEIGESLESMERQTSFPGGPPLLPLRLYFDMHGVRKRFIIADVVSLMPARQSFLQQQQRSSDVNECVDDIKTNRSSCCYTAKDATINKKDCVAEFSIHERLLAAKGNVIGEIPHDYENFIGYVVDVHAIVQQSEWRALWMKRLANEEDAEVRRRILARVLVALSIHAVLSAQDQANDVGVIHHDITTTECESPMKWSMSFLQEGRSESFFVAPLRRVYYPIDTRMLYLVAVSALRETNEIILPALKDMRTRYRNLADKLRTSAEPFDGSLRQPPFCFSNAKANEAIKQLLDVVELLRLEVTYSKLLAAMHRNECAIVHYNLHLEPYSAFLAENKRFWSALYLNTLRLAYIFCIMVKGLGIMPIPPKYRPFLRPVLQFVRCAGGQKELRFRIEEYLLDLEERAKRVLMPLVFRKLSARHIAELDTAADAVAEGICEASQIITALALPEDVLELEPKSVMMPKMLFVNVPSIAGLM